MPSTIQANTACKSQSSGHTVADTCEEIVRNKIPNLLRLYLNPYVAQACYCLTKYVEAQWPVRKSEEYQVFLANSLEESLSGALKLARYDANVGGKPTGVLIVVPHDRLRHFAQTELSDQASVDFLPGVQSVADSESAAKLLADKPDDVGTLVAFDDPELVDSTLLEEFKSKYPARTLILCSNERRLCQANKQSPSPVPDIVLFDESIVNREVPLGTFVATKELYAHWNRRGMATFHSTTYQPNTISSLHFLRSMREKDPDFFQQHASVLGQIEEDLDFRLEMFRSLYNTSLVKLMKAVGFNQSSLTVEGHYIKDGSREVFDGVAGVACSVRGHNPESYVSEVSTMPDTETCREELEDRLHNLTGLEHFSPAVSGASAVEQALKLGLVCQSPRNYVLALKGGFGGKTLFALTGTWKPTLKLGLPGLYPHVVYVDPFADDAREQIETAFEQHPIGVVQCELIQGVGGVRRIPPAILKRIGELRQQHEFLLLVDEVQTGVYRTGPFTRSKELGIEPDLLTIGKAMSDMMFPFAMTLYSKQVRQKLEQRGCDLPQLLEERYGYEFGYRTLLNTLRRAEEEGLEQQVRHCGSSLAESLQLRLQLCPHVREVRNFGLLIGIELNTKYFLLPWLKKLIPQLYLLAMIRRKRFPVMMGFCQYEPNVFKFTPPLTTTPEEVEQICETIDKVIGMSPIRLVARLARELLRF